MLIRWARIYHFDTYSLADEESNEGLECNAVEQHQQEVCVDPVMGVSDFLLWPHLCGNHSFFLFSFPFQGDTRLQVMSDFLLFCCSLLLSLLFFFSSFSKTEPHAFFRKWAIHLIINRKMSSCVCVCVCWYLCCTECQFIYSGQNFFISWILIPAFYLFWNGKMLQWGSNGVKGQGMILENDKLNFLLSSGPVLVCWYICFLNGRKGEYFPSTIFKIKSRLLSL